MQCFVYKSIKKEGFYLYLAREDDFDCVPAPLRQQIGELQLTLNFELNPERKLNREDPAQVLANLKEQGFHLQMPDSVQSLLARHRQQSANPDSLLSDS